MDAIRDAMGLDRLHQDFAEAFRGNDTARLGAFYRDGALLLPPGRRTLVGRDAILAFWQSAVLIQSLRFEPARIEPIGDALVREAGTLEITLRGTGAGTVMASYMSLWTRDEGAWRLEATIWNRRERDGAPRPQAQAGRGRPARDAAPEDPGQGGGTVTYGGGRRSRAGAPGRGAGRRPGGPAGGRAGRGREPNAAAGRSHDGPDAGPRGGYGQREPGPRPPGPGPVGGAYGQRPRGFYGPRPPGPRDGGDSD